MMDAVQERSPRLTAPVELVHLMVVHHCAIWLKPTLRIPAFQSVGRIDHRNRDDFVISNMKAAEAAFRNGRGTGQGRHTDPDNGEQASGGILDGLLHVLAQMSHLCGLSARAERRTRIRRSMSQANCRDFSGRHEFDRIGSGYRIYINEEGYLMGGTYQYQCRQGGENIHRITYYDCYSTFSAW
jgi:hypothetical protein